MIGDQLTDRERRVLQAVIGMYVETAEAAGSRTVARKARLGVSAATVRNTMADLEEKGFLYHPHTSAGRIPTDLAYRYYVDALMRPAKLTADEERRLQQELGDMEEGTPLERLLRHAAFALGLITGELGVAVAPRLDQAVLEKCELIAASADKILLVLTLRSGVVRTVYVDIEGRVPAETLASVTMILNERLAGSTLEEIRNTLTERLRDSAPPSDRAASELLNVFLQSADDLFEWNELTRDELLLGRTSVLASQPEFSSESRLKSLIELTERRELLTTALSERSDAVDPEATLRITIGTEHSHPELNDFTLMTSQYRSGGLSGVIGVIGPTRMPYEKMVSIVDKTSRLVSELHGTPDAERSAGDVGSLMTT